MPLLSTRGAASSKALGQLSVVPAAQADAIDFDGTNDYLSRASDLTGNADGKTFTFSAWVWLDTTGSCQILTAGSTPISLFVSANIFSIYLDSTTGGTRSITMDTSAAQIPLNTFVHILYSADVSSTSLRRLYINDVLVSGVTYTDYNNINIDWTQTSWRVGGNTQLWDGRLSNVYLDYTYRDLTVTANRRLFVTADLKPAAGQAALNPILYLPMNDPTAPGTNAGTGGNFTLTGTVARSGRGPNQYNAPYSDFDGSADYLSRTTLLTGVAVSSAFTFQCVFNTDTQTSQQYLFTVRSGTSDRFYVLINTDFTNARINIEGYNSSATNLLYLSTVYGGIVPNRNYVLTVSLNLTSTATRHIYINGESVSATWSPYTNGSIDFAPSTPTYAVGGRGTSASMNGRLGALWFNTSYIDLSQPANLAKFVTGTGINAKPVDLGASGELPTGTSPLIYLPMYGNNAGKNYGTGGDFTVNSGPYTGARGPNEFWGNKADFNGTTGYLSRTSALAGISDGKVVSFSFWVQPDTTSANNHFWAIGNSAGTQFYAEMYTTATGFDFVLRTNANSAVCVYSYTAGALSTTAVTHLCGMVDLTSASLRGIYLNGSSVGSFAVYVNNNAGLSSPRVGIGARTDWTNLLDGKLSEFYFTTDYIDFSQEANRLKFRDAFGYPVNLTQQITANSIPNPAIYMRFPPTSFGTNSGTGGNFTVNGTITDGGQL